MEIAGELVFDQGLSDLTGFALDGREFAVTVYMEDDDGNRWFGTNAGYILKGWRHSSQLEM